MRLMKKLLAGFVALSLTSCTALNGLPGFDPGTTDPSVRNHAAQALIVAWRALRAFEAAGTVLLTQPAGNPVITPGSPRALQMANIADRARNALNAATDALRNGNSANFTAAMVQAAAALAEARAIVGGNNG